MRIIKSPRLPLSIGLAAICLCASLTPLAGQSAEQKTPPRSRTIPLFATNKDGTPAANLSAADLEVLVGGSPVEGFTLTRGGSVNKLVFLVFDTASMSSNLLGKSKKVAESAISKADDQVRFVVMSIDPYAGLKPICGPTTDKELVLRSIAKSVVAKPGDYFGSRATAGTGIRDAYPDWRDKTPAAMSKREKELDVMQDRQVGTILITSLRTLNEVLGRFPESDKIVHLFSCGIPEGATTDRSRIIYDDEGNIASGKNVDLTSPDRVIYDQIKTAGQSLKTNGALAVFVNPGGTRVGENDAASGELSLHMLANESGGRYFEGADKEIIQALTITEEGYYQLSFPPLPEMPGAGAAIEVRAKDPEVSLASVPMLARTRRFSLMTPQEKQAIIWSVLTDGLVGDIDLKISRIAVDIQEAGDEAQLTAQLPFELSQSEWDIYKVWRGPGKNEVTFEKEHVLSSGPLLTFGMASKENAVQDAVLVHAKSGTVLICQGKDRPKS